MYSHKTTLWFLGISLLIALGFALSSPARFFPRWPRRLFWRSSSIRCTSVCFYGPEARLGWASLISTLALLFLFCVPILIVLTLAANEAVGAAQYLTQSKR